MEKEYRVITECYADFMLMRAAIRLTPNDLHSGINDIGKKLNENYSQRNAIVLVDDDKVRAKFLQDFVLQSEEKKLGLKLLKHKSKRHYAVQISPPVEGWILNLAKFCKVDVTKSPYKLPNTPAKLAGVTKTFSALHNHGLLQLLNTLSQKNPEHFKKLRNWVREALSDKGK